jgi:hypothetical protein
MCLSLLHSIFINHWVAEYKLHSIGERALGSFNFIYLKKKALLSFLHSILYT